MTTTNQPTHRISFARKTGADENGREQLGRPTEIGAAWARKNGKAGSIIRLDVIPANIEDGVLFLLPVDNAPAQGAAQ